jgi:hypothetical protein
LRLAGSEGLNGLLEWFGGMVWRNGLAEWFGGWRLGSRTGLTGRLPFHITTDLVMLVENLPSSPRSALPEGDKKPKTGQKSVLGRGAIRYNQTDISGVNARKTHHETILREPFGMNASVGW